MEQPRKLSPWSLLLLLVALVLVAAILWWSRPQPEPQLRELPPTRVQAVAVERADLVPSVTVTGRLQPARRAALRFEVGGQVAERRVEPGMPVEAGALLLRLDEGDYRDALTRAQAQLTLEREAVARDRRLLELAQGNTELQQREVARLERLGADSLSSRSQLEQARQQLLQLQGEQARLEYSVRTAQARLELRQAEVDAALRNLERCRLVAPFAGTVNAVSVQAGDYVTPAQQAATLIDDGALELYAELGADAAAALALGQAVPVRAGERRFDGRIVALQRDPDPQTRTYGLRVRLTGERLLPGTLAEVTLPLGHLTDQPVVPVSAVLRQNDGTFVFVVTDGRLQKRPVRLGRREGERIVVDGVAPGTTVVARDVAALSDGQAIDAIE